MTTQLFCDWLVRALLLGVGYVTIRNLIMEIGGSYEKNNCL